MLDHGVPPSEVARALGVPLDEVNRWVSQREYAASLRNETRDRLFLAGLLVPTALALLLTKSDWGWLVVVGWPITYLAAFGVYAWRAIVTARRHRQRH